jgi:hypothetical protein
VTPAALADGVAVPDLEAGRLAGVLLVLRHVAERGELEHPVVAPHARVAGDDDVRPDVGPGPDLDVLADDAVGPDLHVLGEPRTGRDDGGGMNSRHGSPKRRCVA